MPLVVLLLVIFYEVTAVNLLLFEEPKIRNADSQILHTTRFGELPSGRRSSDSEADQPTLGNRGEWLICDSFHLHASFPSPDNNKKSGHTHSNALKGKMNFELQATWETFPETMK